MSQPTQRTSLFTALTNLADEITTQKTAAAAAAAPPAGQPKTAAATPPDPGGYQGKSDHPTAQADNGAQTATEGARSSENEADVKKDQRAPGVNSAPEAKPGDDKDKSMNIGMTASAVGDDPSTEDDYKPNKEDPGTSAPATVEDGVKYGAYSFEECTKRAVHLGNQILADLANGFGNRLDKSAATPAAPAAAAAPAVPAAAPAASQKTAAESAMAVGYALAGDLGLTKEAAQTFVEDCLHQSIQEAQLEADLLGGFLQKKAADEAQEGEDHTQPGGGGGDEPGSGAGPAAGGGGAPDLGALAGGGGGDMGGGGGAPPDAGGAAMAGGPPGEEEAMQELISALMELGIPPDMLAQALSQAASGGGGAGGAPPGAGGGGMPPGAGGGGGMPPGAGAGMGAPPGADAGMGAPPMGGAGGAPPPVDGVKLAANIKAFMRSGKFQLKEAKTKRARDLRDSMKRHVLELVG